MILAAKGAVVRGLPETFNKNGQELQACSFLVKGWYGGIQWPCLIYRPRFSC
jgi:hypothetical protein